MELDFVWVISISVFVVAMTASTAVYAHMNARADIKVFRRRLFEWGAKVAAEQDGKWTTLIKEPLGRILERLGNMAQPKDQGEISSIRRSLITAGFRRERAVILFYGAKLLCAFVVLAGIGLASMHMPGTLSQRDVMALHLGGAIIGYFAPVIWLRLAVGQRKDKLLRAIPDALDLLVVCVEAGLGLDMAIARVGDEIKLSHPVLGEEFNLLALELRTGVHRSEALRNLAKRTDLEEVRTLVALLVQTDRFGTSIGQALRVHSEGMRTSRQLRAEELAAKLPVKLLFPLIFFIFPSLFIAILGPAAIKIVKVLIPIMQR